MKMTANVRQVEGPLVADIESCTIRLDDGSEGHLTSPSQCLAFLSVLVAPPLKSALKRRSAGDVLPSAEDFRVRFGYDPEHPDEVTTPAPATTLPFPLPQPLPRESALAS